MEIQKSTLLVTTKRVDQYQAKSTPPSPVDITLPEIEHNLLALSKFITSIVLQILGRIKSDKNPQYSQQRNQTVNDIYQLVMNADKSGGITGPCIIHTLALIHRIVELHGKLTINQLQNSNIFKFFYKTGSHYQGDHFQSHVCDHCSKRASGTCSLVSTESVYYGKEALLFSTLLMMSHKYNEDWAYHVKGWSKFSYYQKSKLISTERDLLRVLEYDVHMTREFFEEWVTYVCNLAKAWKCSAFENRNVWTQPPQQKESKKFFD